MTPSPSPTPSVPAEMERELLACPFCGSNASRFTFMDESLFSHAGVEFMQICCGECDAQTGRNEYHEDAIAPDFSEIIPKCYANPTREHVEWLADKIVKGGDYAKEAAALLRKWPQSEQAAPVLTDIGMLCPTAPARIWLQVDPDPEEDGKPVYEGDEATWCADKIYETYAAFTSIGKTNPQNRASA